MLRAKRSSFSGRWIQELSLPRRASGENTGDSEEGETKDGEKEVEIKHDGEPKHTPNAIKDSDKENYDMDKSRNPTMPLKLPPKAPSKSTHEVPRPHAVKNDAEVEQGFSTEEKSSLNIHVTIRRNKSDVHVKGDSVVAVPHSKSSLSGTGVGRPVAVSMPISRNSPPIMAPISHDIKQHPSQLQHQHNSQDQHSSIKLSSTRTPMVNEGRPTSSMPRQQASAKSNHSANLPSNNQGQQQQQQQQHLQHDRQISIGPGRNAASTIHHTSATVTTVATGMQEQQLLKPSQYQYQSQADTGSQAAYVVTPAVLEHVPNSSQYLQRDDNTAERMVVLAPHDLNQRLFKAANSNQQHSRSLQQQQQQQIADTVVSENQQINRFGAYVATVNTPIVPQDHLSAVNSSAHRRHHHHHHHHHHDHHHQRLHPKQHQEVISSGTAEGLAEERRNTMEDSEAPISTHRHYKRSSTVHATSHVERQVSGSVAAASANSGSHTYTPSSTRHQQRYTGTGLQDQLLHQQPKPVPQGGEMERRMEKQVSDACDGAEHRSSLQWPAEQPAPANEVVVMRSARGSLRKLKKLKSLGGGGSSKIYQVLSESNEVFALKEVYMRHLDPVIQQSFLKEVQLLKQLQEKQEIIRLHDYAWDKEAHILYILLDCADMDLNNLIKKGYLQRSVNPSVAVWQLWNEVLRIVKVIHDEDIIHNDLKPENFVCKGCNLYLIDFGISSRIEAEHTSIERDVRCGTLNYMAPETIEATGENDLYKVGKPSDIWSLGCILYQMVYKKTPFDHIKNKMKKWQAIVNCSTSVAYPQVPSSYTKLIEIIKKCLTKDPKTRPSIDELLSYSSPEHFSLP